MQDSYDDIIHLSRPQYDDILSMPISKRAAQFSPFAALTGFDDAIAETARKTECRRELTEDEINELNANLDLLIADLSSHPEVCVRYFVPDKTKCGGKYTEKNGRVRIYDSYTNELVFTDGDRIKVSDMLSVEML